MCTKMTLFSLQKINKLCLFIELMQKRKDLTQQNERTAYLLLE
ncbi:MAG: hypothetical protein ACI82S_000025 [Patiriisocius sp.]|jgi:hypothetical protein